MSSYVKQVAEAVRNRCYQRYIESDEELDAIIASVPLPEPVGWKVTGVSCLYYDEFAAKEEAKRLGGTTVAIPLYADPMPVNQHLFGAINRIAELERQLSDRSIAVDISNGLFVFGNPESTKAIQDALYERDSLKLQLAERDARINDLCCNLDYS